MIPRPTLYQRLSDWWLKHYAWVCIVFILVLLLVGAMTGCNTTPSASDPSGGAVDPTAPAQRDLHWAGTLAILGGVLLTALPFLLPASIPLSWSGGPVLILTGIATHTLAPHANVVGWITLIGTGAGVAMSAFGTADNLSLIKRGKHLLGLGKAKETDQ